MKTIQFFALFTLLILAKLALSQFPCNDVSKYAPLKTQLIPLSPQPK